MKKIVSLSAGIIFSITAFSQAPTWTFAGGIGSTIPDYSNSITLDAWGNIYVAGGYFNGTVDFDMGPGTYNLSSGPASADFVLKLDPSANIIWAKAIPCTGVMWGTSIAVDPVTGAAYVTGRFTGTTDFDPGPGIFNLTASYTETFVFKLDADGSLLWALAVPSSAGVYNSSSCIRLDAAGKVYLTGYFSGTVDFDSGPGVYNLTAAGSEDIFVTKLDESGNLMWAVAMGGTGSDRGMWLETDLTGSGGAFITGYFNSTADFDPGPGTFNLTSVGGRDIFVCRLNSSGNFVWAERMGGNSGEQGLSLAVDYALGNPSIYVTGNFLGTADFDPGAGTFYLTPSGGNDIFITKLDNAGNFIWAKVIGGTSTDTPFALYALPDGTGGVYAAGQFKLTVDFDPGPGIFNLTSAGSDDAFFMRLDTAGNLIWAKSVGSTNGETAASIISDGFDNVYVTGSFGGNPVAFDGFTFSSAGNADIFIARTGMTESLPIQLLSFEGSAANSVVNLDWTTACESNNDYFTVERSNTPEQFERIEMVDGAGNSTRPLNYFFTDEHPLKGVSYYRLKQTDFDGTSTYSNIIAIDFNYNGIISINIFYTRATDELSVNGFSGKGEINIYSTLGEKILSKEIDGGEIKLDVKNLAPGIYVVKVAAGDKVFVKKVVKE